MKAAYLDSYGIASNIVIKDVSKPVPKGDQVLVKVMASTVTSGNVKLRNFKGMSTFYKVMGRLAFGIFKPRQKIIGSEYAGIVEAIGPKVTLFKIGDKVYGLELFGANADYLCTSQSKVTKMPKCSYEEAACLPFGCGTAYQAINDYKDKSVLINGISGCVGLYALQLCTLNNCKVTGVCSTKNKQLVMETGCERVIDYTKEDVFMDKEQFDVILDTIGNMTYPTTRQLLKPTGHFVTILPEFTDFFKSATGQQKIACVMASDKVSINEEINKLVNDKKIKSVIGDRFELDSIVKAHELVESGHKVGSTVIIVDKEYNKG